MTPPANGPLRHSLIVAIAILLAGALIAGSILWGLDRLVDRATDIVASRAAAERAPPSPSVDIADVSLDGTPFIGDPAAPVAMAYWYDYQCPFCQRVELNVMPKLIADYVDAGKLRIYFKDFQFLGPDSFAAALASRAVWEVNPDKFYQWHRAVYENQDGENSGWGNADDIIALTRTIEGIDAGRVEELVATRASEYRSAIEADLREGSSMGIKGTPGTIVGTRLISGAASYEEFRAAVDAALASQ